MGVCCHGSCFETAWSWNLWNPKYWSTNGWNTEKIAASTRLGHIQLVSSLSVLSQLLWEAKPNTFLLSPESLNLPLILLKIVQIFIRNSVCVAWFRCHFYWGHFSMCPASSSLAQMGDIEKGKIQRRVLSSCEAQHCLRSLINSNITRGFWELLNPWINKPTSWAFAIFWAP